MRIYFQIWGPLPPEISTYLIWHDAGELVTGDIPFPFKSYNPMIKKEFDALEANAVMAMGGGTPVVLTTIEQQRVKLVDVLDMYEQGKVEVAMGNQYALPIVNDPLNVIRKLVAALPPEDRDIVSKYMGLGIL